jgi:hypothetical protein
MMQVTFVLAIALVLAPGVSHAQKKTMSAGGVASVTATVEAIDSANRLVTLKDTADGHTETVYCGPNVKRFDALKVGDKVTFRYHESMVLQLRKAGTTAAAPEGSAGITRTPGEKPGGTIARQMTASVTVVSVDEKNSAITVKADDGSTFSSRVENKKDLEGVSAGDRIDITYTQALAVSVDSPK